MTLPDDLLSIDEIGARLEATLSSSPADETELVWIEVRRQAVSNRGPRATNRPARERTIQVRVHDRGRLGSHRTGAASRGELENAVRQALAQSRAQPRLPGLPHLPADANPLDLRAPLHDPEVAALDPRAAQARLRGLAGRRETAILSWAEGHLAVFNSRGVRRSTAVTAAVLEVRRGRRPGSGRAAAAARTLEGLAPEGVFERARAIDGDGPAAEPPAGPRPAVLAPEAVIQLWNLLNQVGLSARSYQEGSSFLREHLGVQVFDPALDLVDDGTDAGGLPFPFDLEGTAKRPVQLIAAGIPKTPALDHHHAALLGLPPTGHAIAAGDARAQNLFFRPRELTFDDLLGAAEGGLWIGWLDRLECFDPVRVLVRAVARGVRGIRGGSLAAPLPDRRWEDSLLRAFSSLLGVGREVVTWSREDGLLGGVSAPAVALARWAADGPAA